MATSPCTHMVTLVDIATGTVTQVERTATWIGKYCVDHGIALPEHFRNFEALAERLRHEWFWQGRTWMT